MTTCRALRTARAVITLFIALRCVPQSFAASSSFPELVLQGRFGGVNGSTAYVGDLPLLFSWASSTVFLTFRGTSVNATLTALNASIAYSGYNRFAFQIDQQAVATQSQDLNSTVIQWSYSGLPYGTHNFTITKLSEPAYGEATLDSIQLGGNGT